MGSDVSPQVLLRSVCALQKKELVEVEFLLFASSQVQQEVGVGFLWVTAEEEIRMEESPLHAVRQKKSASLCLGMACLREKKIDAFISAGNTGALVVASKQFLSLLPGVKRSALLSLLPTKRKPVAVLDVGANITWEATHLVQFAALGAAYQTIHGIFPPRVGLLNIGTEANRGSEPLRKAYATLTALQEDRWRFVGNVEAKSVFEGEVDVVVTDGFTGNIFLKTVEGVASFIVDEWQGDRKRGPDPEPIGLGKVPTRWQFDPSQYPGAILCGVDGVVVKCHGNTSEAAFASSIRSAVQLIQMRFLEKLAPYFPLCPTSSSPG